MSEKSEITEDPKGSEENPVNLEEKLAELTSALEAERASKERILKESKEYKEGLQSYKLKESEREAKRKEAEEERLKKEGQYSTLLEQRDNRIKELEESLNNTRGEVESRDTAIVNFRKAAAFERTLGGKLKKDAYWNHVDFESIAINPETGDIDRSSLDKVVKSFSEDFGELVDFGNTANLPNTSPSGSSGKLSYEQWKKLPLKDRKARMKDVID